MGSFLEKPETGKHTVGGEGNGLRYSSSAMQGWRVSMEDAHIHEPSLAQAGAGRIGFYGVFDGHGGELAAKRCAQLFIDFLKKQPGWEAAVASGGIPEKIKEVYSDAHFELDAYLRQMPVFQTGEDRSGSTSITSIVTPTHWIVANTGDSRCVLASGGAAVAMSEDHKPTNEGETQRIYKAGGIVEAGRVQGDLAVSRAFADFGYKNNTAIDASKQMVTVMPDITIRQRSDQDEFLVLACDGIWDVMSNEECCNFVRGEMMDGEHNLGIIAESLIDQCLIRGSRDNMSVVLVVCPGAKFGPLRPSPSEEERIARGKRAGGIIDENGNEIPR